MHSVPFRKHSGPMLAFTLQSTFRKPKVQKHVDTFLALVMHCPLVEQPLGQSAKVRERRAKRTTARRMKRAISTEGMEG